jgi:methylase of polypeptide subunit release factors
MLKSNLLSSVDKDLDILLCNLPYVPDDLKINRAATHEPKLAIYGGPDGLDVYRKLFKQLKDHKNIVLYLLCESLPAQHSALKEIACESGYQEIKKNDFIQVFKRAKK